MELKTLLGSRDLQAQCAFEIEILKQAQVVTDYRIERLCKEVNEARRGGLNDLMTKI